MITFFVGTPYQLIAALQIRTRLFTNEAADLYLVETNTDLFLYEQALRSVGWFQNVYRTDEPRAIYDRSSTQAQRFLNYFWPRTKIARLLRTKRYERMFSTALGFGNTYYFHYLQKGNPDIRFSYFEEGLGMYTAAVFNCPKMMRVLEQLGFQNVYQPLMATICSIRSCVHAHCRIAWKSFLRCLSTLASAMCLRSSSNRFLPSVATWCWMRPLSSSWAWHWIFRLS